MIKMKGSLTTLVTLAHFSHFSHLIFLTALLFCSTAFAQTNIYTGGSADGYDETGEPRVAGWPQIDNAGEATGVTTNSAWLNGMLLSTGGAPTTVHVYWGDQDGTNSAGAWNHWTNFGVRTRMALTTNVTSLSQNTWYYYRFYATNADAGVWAAQSATFKTHGVPEVDNDGGADPVGRISAGLNGCLTAGVSAQAYIYWGQDINNWSHTNSVGEVAEGGFSASVSGLTPGTNYYYRCYATNAYGEAWADSATNFTTAQGFLFFVGGDADGYDGRHTNTMAQTGAPVGTVFSIQ